jgi:hypothetical protein
MKKVDVIEYIESLGVKLPPLEEFWKLGDSTALWTNKDNQFVRLNYYRGPLLYALVAKYKPKTVLEFGTAKGYATLCMAWAMDDFGIDGKIYTLDTISPNQRIDTPIKKENNVPSIESTSVNDIWKEIAKPKWIQRIIPLTGMSSEIMKKIDLPKFEMAYIDADHFYKGVKHDFYSFLKCAAEKFGVLFDDYIQKDGFGVKKLIDEDVSKNFNVTLIHTDLEGNLKKYTDSDYGMCWIHTDSLNKSLEECYNNFNIEKTLDEYNNMFEKRLKIRKIINQKIPFLRRVRFLWWKRY